MIRDVGDCAVSKQAFICPTQFRVAIVSVKRFPYPSEMGNPERMYEFVHKGHSQLIAKAKQA